MLLGLHVRVELVLPIEALVAGAAYERPHPAVHHLVPGQIGGVREFLIARLASVRFLSRMLPQVFVKITPMLERFITIRTTHLTSSALLLMAAGRRLWIASAAALLLVTGRFSLLYHIHQQWKTALFLATIRTAAIVRMLLLFVLLLAIVATLFHFLPSSIGAKIETVTELLLVFLFFAPCNTPALPSAVVFLKQQLTSAHDGDAVVFWRGGKPSWR